jgi:NADPH2:quinone reductase
MVKRLTITGSTLRPRTREVRRALPARSRPRCGPCWRQARSRIVIDATFPLTKAADAHRRMEASQHIGKPVLTT